MTRRAISAIRAAPKRRSTTPTTPAAATTACQSAAGATKLIPNAPAAKEEAAIRFSLSEDTNSVWAGISVAGYGMTHGTFQFYPDGASAWEAMLADCRGARESIDFEQYIFKEDGIGRAFIETLAARAAAGVRVRLLIDAVGGIFLSNASIARLRNAGVGVRLFKPVRSWVPHRISSWFFRDHRKFLIVDGRVAQTGGIGVNDRMRDWRDTQVRLEGPIVREMQDSFERMWRSAAGGTFHFTKFPDNVFTAEKDFVLQTSAPHLRQRFMRRALIRAIRTAHTYVYLTTPYFIPDIKFFVAVRRAARRGVGVRILLPGVSDHFLLDVASGSYFDSFLRAGVKIYQYSAGRRILHAKTAAIDDVWTTVGSTNLDNLSLRWNYEANISSINAEFAREIRKHFLNDLKSSREVWPDAWRRRPIYIKLLEALTWPVHEIL